MNMKQWKADYLAAAEKKAMPVLSFPGTQLTGQTVQTVVSDPRAQADCMIAIAKRFPAMAAALGPMDLSVEAQAFGAQVRFAEGEVPTVVGALLDIDEPETADTLAVPAVGAGRTGVYVQAMKLAKQAITDRPVLSGCIGPFSLAGRLLEMSNVMIACVEEPEMLETVLDKVSDFITRYILALKEAGADGVIMAEPAAGLLSPGLNADFSVPWVKRIADAVKDDSFLFCYHNCGPYTPRQLPDLLTIGADLYHFGDAIDLDEVKDGIPEGVLFSGNVSPVTCFKTGTPASTAQATELVLQKCGGKANFVPSSGCDVPPTASLDNVAAFFETVQRFYAEKR